MYDPALLLHAPHRSPADLPDIPVVRGQIFLDHLPLYPPNIYQKGSYLVGAGMVIGLRHLGHWV